MQHGVMVCGRNQSGSGRLPHKRSDWLFVHPPASKVSASASAPHGEASQARHPQMRTRKGKVWKGKMWLFRGERREVRALVVRHFYGEYVPEGAKLVEVTIRPVRRGSRSRGQA